ncbi:MAG: type II toxin-antitoxin system RelE/ParE family toxin [Planctomycetaceae bacterium]
MTEFRVIIHERAKEDIRRNARWWSDHHSRSQAEKWFDFAFASMEKLDRFPESHPIAAESPKFDVELRELLFGMGSRPGYRALFAIHGNDVHVLTVRRAAEDSVSPEDLKLDFSDTE